jgi:hypothetical protein
MAFTIDIWQGQHELCDICRSSDPRTLLHLHQVTGRGRNRDSNIIFVHLDCFERKLAHAKKRYAQSERKE